MKIFRMIIALLITSLATGSSILAIRAGTGARAGLPNLNTLLKIDRTEEEEISLDGDNGVIKKVRKQYLKTDNANTRRKLVDAFKVYAQQQSLGQNIYNIYLVEDDDNNPTRTIDLDSKDAANVAEQVAGFINKANDKINDTKNIKRLGSNKDDNKDFVEAMLYRIAKPIIERQFREWLKQQNSASVKEAMAAYNEKLNDENDDAEIGGFEQQEAKQNFYGIAIDGVGTSLGKMTLREATEKFAQTVLSRSESNITLDLLDEAGENSIEIIQRHVSQQNFPPPVTQ